MSESAGEGPAAKGREFERACQTLLERLGYTTVFFDDRGFDLVGDPPKPTETTIAPLFAPRGRTAFEFKGGKGKSVESVATKFLDKLRKAKRSNVGAIRKVKSGVVVVEGYVSDQTKRKVFSKFAIAVWDFRTILFLACKSHNRFVIGRGSPFKEFQLDNATTVVYENQVPKMGDKNVIRFVCQLYYYHLNEKLTTERLRSMIVLLTRKLETLAGGLTIPIYASIVLYCLPGFTDDLTPRNLTRLFEAASAGRIIYDAEPSVHSFNTAPWEFLL